MKQELFVLLRTVVPISFSHLEPVQELEAVGGSLFILLCVVTLCSDMVENGICLGVLFFFHCLYYDNIPGKQVSAGTTRV